MMLIAMELNKIYEGDALEILKKFGDNTVDVGITSPPYNKGEKHKGWLVKNVKYNKSSDCIPEAEYQKSQVDVLNEIHRATKPGGSFFYNHKLRWDKGVMIHPFEWVSKTDWTIRQEIVWDRAIAANIRGWRFWQVEEKIFWLYKPLKNDKIGEEIAPKHALLSSVWRIPPENHNKHPAPFPLTLPARAIYSVLDGRRGVVLDPYAGSGTTLVAAKLLGCDFIGIEISKEYIKDAELRIKNCENERTKLNEEISKHVVRKTFSERKMNGEHTGRFRKEYKQKTLLG